MNLHFLSGSEEKLTIVLDWCDASGICDSPLALVCESEDKKKSDKDFDDDFGSWASTNVCWSGIFECCV